MTINSNQICAICDELTGTRGTRLSDALGDTSISNATLMLSDHFVVIPSVGPLVLGHSLIVTREHTNNIMASLQQPELRELRDVCERSMEILLDSTPGVHLLCFEHGARSKMPRSLCSTGHGHLHEVPLAEDDAAAVLKAVGGRSFEVNSFQEIRDSLALLQEYIVAFSLIPGQSEVSGAVLDASEVPSQHLRRLVADQLGIAGWNWKANMNAELLRRTLALGFEINKHGTLQSLSSSESVI